MSSVRTRSARDQWFYTLLLASTLSTVWLFMPFFNVLLFAGVVAAVVWPLQERLVVMLGGRRLVASMLLTSALGLLVFVPLVMLLYVFVTEGILLAQHGVEWVRSGQLDVWLKAAEEWLRGPWLTALRTRFPSTAEPLEMVGEPLKNALASGLNAASNGLPALLGSVVNSVIDAVIFVFAVVTLLADGPRLMRFVMAFSPIEDKYERRLVGVFREQSMNLVVGGFMTAAAQGVVAAVGLWFFGVPRPLFFGVMTAVTSFIPVVGTAIVLVPSILYAAAQYGLPAALGLTLYSVVFTGSVDNLLRPVFMRGSTEIHPLLIFLAIFGGMAWLGVAGVLVGPVLIAVFLALADIYQEDFGQRGDGAQREMVDPPA